MSESHGFGCSLCARTHARTEHIDTEWKGQLVITELARESRLQAIYNLWAEFEAAKEMNYQISFFEDTITLRRAIVPRAHAPPHSVLLKCTCISDVALISVHCLG